MTVRAYLKKPYQYIDNTLKAHSLDILSLSIFTNKQIALVGNATSLLHQHYGKEIDAHDIVIRMNLGYPYTSLKYSDETPYIPEKWIRSVFIDRKTNPPTLCHIVSEKIPETLKMYCSGYHTGFKTSIWSFASNDPARQKTYFPLFKDALRLWPHPTLTHLNKQSARFSLKPDKNYFDLVAQKIQHRPSSGLILMTLLSHSDAKVINLYGFDFFETRHIHRHSPSKQHPHDPQAEQRYAHMLMEKDQRIHLKQGKNSCAFFTRLDYV